MTSRGLELPGPADPPSTGGERSGLEEQADASGPAPGESGRPLAWVALCAVAIYALAVLIWRDAPLWYDEAWVVEALAEDPLKQYLYRAVLAVWLTLFGAGATGYRLLSFALGAASLVLLIRCARWARADPVATALVALGLPLVLYYGVMIRPYALVLLASSASLAALLALDARPSTRAYAVVALSGVAAAYSHPAMLATVVLVQHGALGAQALSAPREERRSRLRAQLVVGALQIALLAPIAGAVLEAKQTFYDAVPEIHPGFSWSALGTVARDMAPGRWGPPAWHALGGAALLVVVVAGVRRRGAGRWTLIVALVGPFLAAALASAYKPMFVARVLLPVTPAIALAAGRALPSHGRLRQALCALVALIGLAAFSAGGWLQQDMRSVQAAIGSRCAPGDGLLIQPPFAAITYRANYRLGSAQYAPLLELGLDAPTPLAAARVDFASFPRRTFVILQVFEGRSRGLEAELPLRFRTVELLGTFRGPFRLYACEEPLPFEAAMAASRSWEERGGEPWLAAYREGVLLLRAGRAGEALRAFERARERYRAEDALDELEQRSNRIALPHAIALAARWAGTPEQVRAALEEAEAAGLRLPPAQRAELLGPGPDRVTPAPGAPGTSPAPLEPEDPGPGGP